MLFRLHPNSLKYFWLHAKVAEVQRRSIYALKARRAEMITVEIQANKQKPSNGSSIILVVLLEHNMKRHTEVFVCRKIGIGTFC